jgi:hypothetical protein
MGRKSIATAVAEGSYTSGEEEDDDEGQRDVIRANEASGKGRKKKPRNETGYSHEQLLRMGRQFGPLRFHVYCEYIVDHGGVDVQYVGQDEKKWQDGCWRINKKDCDPQYVGPKGLEHIAVSILGMTPVELHEGGQE